MPGTYQELKKYNFYNSIHLFSVYGFLMCYHTFNFIAKKDNNYRKIEKTQNRTIKLNLQEWLNTKSL